MAAFIVISVCDCRFCFKSLQLKKSKRSQKEKGNEYLCITADLSMILSPLGVAAHQYTDDTQTYVHGVASEAISLVEKMLLVSDVIGTWLSSNRLRLNP